MTDHARWQREILLRAISVVAPANQHDRRRWMILTLVSLSHIVGATGQYSINTLAPFYQLDLQVTRTQVGLFFTAFYVGMACLSYPAGWLADRLGVHKATLSGHVLLGLFTFTASLAPSFQWAFVSFLFAGLGYSFLNPASTKGMMEWFQSDERATAMGVKQTGVPAGGVVTALLAPFVVLFFGWRGALAVLGLTNLVFGFVFLLCWRAPPRRNQVYDRAEQHGAHESTLAGVRRLATISLGTAVLLTAQMSLLTYLPLYLKEAIGISPHWASRALALAQVGGMTGRVGWGILSDRLFRGRRKDVLVLSGITSAVLAFLLSLVSSATSLVVLLLIIYAAGVCMIGYQGVSYALIGELAGTARTGTAMGLVISVNSLGAILGTPLFGYLVDQTGSYPIAWTALGITVLCGVVALQFFQEPKNRARALTRPPHKS